MALFNREVEAKGQVETVIGPSVKVEGNFIGSGNVRVEGTVNGTLKTSKDLRIGEGAKVKADVDAANIMVAGEIHGNVRTGGKLELTSCAKILGNIEAAVLIVAPGAMLHGKCTMLKSETAAAASPLPTEKKRGAAST